MDRTPSEQVGPRLDRFALLSIVVAGPIDPAAQVGLPGLLASRRQVLRCYVILRGVPCRGFESGERYLRSPRPVSAEFLVSVA